MPERSERRIIALEPNCNWYDDYKRGIELQLAAARDGRTRRRLTHALVVRS